MSDDQWIQASLPVRNGGLGIRSAVMLASSAFLASAAGTRNLQDRLLHDVPLTITDPLVEEAFTSWSSKSNAPPPIEQKAHIQREWDCKLISHALQGLSERASDSAAKARLLAMQSPHFRDWLHALPITTAGLRMSGEVLRIAFGIRLGTALCEKHTCKCGATGESNGHHGLSCKKEQEGSIDMICSMTLFGGLSPEPKYRPSKSPMTSPDLTAKGLMESPSYLGTEVVVWRGMSQCQILSLHPTNI